MLGKIFDFLSVDTEKDNCVQALKSFNLPITGSTWWAKYPKRAVEEIYKMKENTSASLRCTGNQLVWEERVVNNFGATFVISIKSMENHPFAAPKVFLKSPCVEPHRDRHMYKDGSLCLFKPEFYSSRMSILEIRNLSCSWCFCYSAYKNTGKWSGAEEFHF